VSNHFSRDLQAVLALFRRLTFFTAARAGNVLLVENVVLDTSFAKFPLLLELATRSAQYLLAVFAVRLLRAELCL
jgi:hypothetical protein